MSTTASVLFEEADSVAIIRMDDGKVNALGQEMLSALSDALNVAIAQDSAAIVVGREGFLSAGFDLSVMRAGPDERNRLVLSGLDLALKIFESPIPVVVCCTGHAIAAGTLLLLPAEQVIVADTPVKIGFNETTIGIELSPFVLELARYRLLPSAYNQILQGKLYDAPSAQRVGYVDEVVAPENLLPRALEVAGHFAGLDPTSYRRTKEALRSDTATALRHALARRRGAIES